MKTKKINALITKYKCGIRYASKYKLVEKKLHKIIKDIINGYQMDSPLYDTSFNELMGCCAISDLCNFVTDNDLKSVFSDINDIFIDYKIHLNKSQIKEFTRAFLYDRYYHLIDLYNTSTIVTLNIKEQSFAYSIMKNVAKDINSNKSLNIVCKKQLFLNKNTGNQLVLFTFLRQK